MVRRSQGGSLDDQGRADDAPSGAEGVDGRDGREPQEPGFALDELICPPLLGFNLEMQKASVAESQIGSRKHGPGVPEVGEVPDAPSSNN